MYGGLDYASTMQTESYVGLIGIAIAWLLLVRRTRGAMIGAGLLCGTLFLLKFTLGAFLAGTVAAEILLFRSGWKRSMEHAGLILLGFAAYGVSVYPWAASLVGPARRGTTVER